MFPFEGTQAASNDDAIVYSAILIGAALPHDVWWHSMEATKGSRYTVASAADLKLSVIFGVVCNNIQYIKNGEW